MLIGSLSPKLPAVDMDLPVNKTQIFITFFWLHIYQSSFKSIGYFNNSMNTWFLEELAKSEHLVFGFCIDKGVASRNLVIYNPAICILLFLSVVLLSRRS